MEIIKPYPGVENIPITELTIDQSNDFIEILQPQILNQAYVENKAITANRMFSFGFRWARKFPNITEKSKQNSGNFRNKNRPDQIKIDSYDGSTYGYFRTDQNNNSIPTISVLNPIINFIQSKLGIDMSNYDSVLGNIYENNSFIHQHRDITESRTAINYPVIVINLGSNGGLLYDKATSDKNLDSSTAYAEFDRAIKQDKSNKNDMFGEYRYENRIEILNISNGGIYAFGIDGVNRFTFNHRIVDGIGETPTKPIIVPEWSDNGEKIGEKILTNYRITLTFRRARDLNKFIPNIPIRK